MPSLVTQNLGIEEWFRSRVQSQPDADAIVEGDQILSYFEVDALAKRLATYLSKYKVNKEEPIGVLLPRGAANIISQVAILRLGASCVPLDVSFPDQRIHDLYNALKIRIVLLSPIDRHRLPSFEQVVLTDADTDLKRCELEINGETRDIAMPAGTGPDHRTHVLYTSGTTGLPKPVEIMSKGISRIAFNSVVLQHTKVDRVAHIAAPSFDAALFEIWATLITGGTIVVLSKDAVINPWALYDSLTRHRITSTLMTPALLHHIIRAIPHAFAELDTVATGGEASDPQILQALLEAGAPKKLVHAYGPTEGSVVASYHEVRLEDCKAGTIPIGKPLDNTTLYVLGESGLPVSKGEIGELYIGGDAVARGYYNRPEANSKSFVQITGLSKPGRTERLYRTGDLGRYTQDGLVEFVARMDDSVKIRGHLVNLKGIEAVIAKSGLTDRAVVQTVQRPGKERYIVAFTAFKHHDNGLSDRLIEYLKQTIPPYEIPRIEPRTSFPMTTHGKVDSKELVLHHIQAMEAVEKTLDSTLDSSESTILWLQRLWTSVLDVGSVHPDSNFFELGGSSLQAARVLIGIRQRFNVDLSMQQLYDAPTLQELTELVCNRTECFGIDLSKIDTWMADSKITDHLYPLPGKCPSWNAPGEGRIFMTGATGYLGQHFLSEIIKRDDVKEVRCLVRCTEPHVGHARIISGFQNSEDIPLGWLHKIVVVPGDLGHERFGLSSIEFSDLALWASAVFHFGAYVSYVQPYAVSRPINVIGTLNCIKLAITGRPKALHYMSTAAVLGSAYFMNTRRVMEGRDLGLCIESLPYDTGYMQSKWVAEQLVHSMVRKGLPAIVYRPGQVMGDGVCGPINKNDFTTRFILGCMMLRCRPILPNQTRLMIPVDYFTAIVIHASSQPRNLGKSLHLVPQSQEEDMDIETMWAHLRYLGYNIEAQPFTAWAARLAEDQHLLTNPLFSMLPMLQRVVIEDRTRWQLQEGQGVYDTTQCQEAIADMDWESKTGIDLEFLRNFMAGLMSGRPLEQRAKRLDKLEYRSRL